MRVQQMLKFNGRHGSVGTDRRNARRKKKTTDSLYVDTSKPWKLNRIKLAIYFDILNFCLLRFSEFLKLYLKRKIFLFVCSSKKKKKSKQEDQTALNSANSASSVKQFKVDNLLETAGRL